MMTLVYDIEILKAIPPNNPAERIEGIQYCEGWTDYAGAGIACICAWESGTNTMRYFVEPLGLKAIAGSDLRLYSIWEFQAWIHEADRLVTFNGVRFDNRVLAAHGFSLPNERSRRHYDLMFEGWRGQGLDLTEPDNWENPAWRKLRAGGLNDYALANLERGKSSTGDQAPIRWQRGDYRFVLDYCALDVALTRDLFLLGQQRGWLENPKTGKRASINKDWL